MNADQDFDCCFLERVVACNPNCEEQLNLRCIQIQKNVNVCHLLWSFCFAFCQAVVILVIYLRNDLSWGLLQRKLKAIIREQIQFNSSDFGKFPAQIVAKANDENCDSLTKSKAKAPENEL